MILNRKILLFFTILVLLSSGAAFGEQFFCVDEDYVHHNWYYHFEFPWQPEDWTSPTNYAEGTVYIRAEVRSIDMPIDCWLFVPQGAPPDTTAGYYSPQLCLFQDVHIPSKHACFNSWTIRIDGPGLYHGTRDLDSMYQYDVIDWTRELMNPMVIGKTYSPIGTAYADESIDMRFTAIIVAPGDDFVPPYWWYTPSAIGDDTDPGLTWGALKALFR